MELCAIDTHAAGEPTRIIYSELPLGQGSMADRRERFGREFDHIRTAALLEPRGSEVLVGAHVSKATPFNPAFGTIFFNNAGPLNMCGHGTMCVASALRHLGWSTSETVEIETNVGRVLAKLMPNNWVEIQNIASYRLIKDAVVELEGKYVKGDVAWGGNWFFLTHESPWPVNREHIDQLTDWAKRLQAAINSQGLTGANRAPIDHIEICDDHRNFVLCPGGEYDRSPCGTGTSAHMACLFADGLLKQDEEWRQESVIGTEFFGSVKASGDRVLPTIRGQAFVTGELKLILNDEDPLRFGIR